MGMTIDEALNLLNNHKRRTVRIDREDAERDIDCYWSKEEKDNGKYI